MYEGKLFNEVALGPLSLKNCIAMAPLTRQCAEDDGTPNDEMVAYYARRARGGVGLIISEGTYPADNLSGIGYLNQPGCENDKQQEGWQQIIEACHRHGAKIIIQLMHAGRVADPRTIRDGESPVSASDTHSAGWVLYTDNDTELHDRELTGAWPQVTFPPSRALTEDELSAVADDFAAAAKRAVDAGADGVEVHGANGYLLYQFTDPKQNLRTDAYGGSAENNMRFPNMVVDRVRSAIGPDKLISYRISQDGVDDFTGFWQAGQEYVEAIGKALKDMDADVIHWSSFDWKTNRFDAAQPPIPVTLKKISGKPFITNGNVFDGETAEEVFAQNAGDVVAIGRPIFAHPDWPYIVASGMDYDWMDFDRKYVIHPPYDYTYAYPASLPERDWSPEAKVKR
ncbi:NADH:flavin oxidoreductase [Alphaproteobacteria bacterium]|jgi:2,4-dienoyl-CoA reductase-like NADH-dependent reductase (Old Yellow Enzyme family)|nr:NADH:flavin oxidoreductase [Alphaproteobacteria bacterium]